MKTTIVLTLTLIAGSAYAQQPASPAASAPTVQVDSRLAPWLGCWRLDDDLAGTGARMCVTPEKGGVRLQTLVGTQKGIDEVVVPDGAPHAITDSDCKGTERAEFSKDGARLFRNTDVTCGKEAPRSIKSVMFMASGPALVNVQYLTGESATTNIRVQRYRRSSNQTLADGSKAPQPSAQTARLTTQESTTWSIDDVIEASGKLPAEALQAALTEVNHKFDLSKKTLLALNKGGVQEEVIDVMVALTYPKRFVIQRAGGVSAPAGVLTGGGWFDPFMSPMLMGPMANCYTPYGYGYRSYYSMCGSSLYGYGLYDYYGRGYPGYYGWVDLGAIPSVGSGGGGVVEPQGDGRVVSGRGFTQVRPRESEPSPRINTGSNGGAWSGASSSGAASGGGFSSGSGSSSGSSGGGSSSGGDSGARVAVPKGGGGR